jgi:hypothetical protein
MKSIQTKSALTVKTNVKAGGLSTVNHTRGALKVRSAVKAGGLNSVNHNAAILALA